MSEAQKGTEAEGEVNGRMKNKLKTEYKYISCCGRYYLL